VVHVSYRVKIIGHEAVRRIAYSSVG